MTATATPANADVDRRGARPAARARADERPPPESPLRRRAGRERGGAAPRPADARLRGVEDGVAIVYARSRRSCEEIARTLRGHGIRRRALPRGARGRGADARAGGVRGRPHARRRRDDGLRHGHRQGERPARRARQPSRTRSRATCRWSAAPAATAGRATPCSSPATPTRRRCGGSRSATSRRRAPPERLPRAARRGRHVRPGGARRGRRRCPRPAGPRRDARAGGHRPARLRRGAGDADRAAPRRHRRGRGARRRCSSAMHARPPRASIASSRSPTTRALPAPPGGRALRRVARRRRAARATCARRARRVDCAPIARPLALPDDPARAIVDAVASLTWPLGRRSLVAMLRGSVKAPPSARRSPAFGSPCAPPRRPRSRAGCARSRPPARSSRSRATASASSGPSRSAHAARARLRPRRTASVADRSSPSSGPGARGARARTASRPMSCCTMRHSHELAARRPGSPAELAVVKGSDRRRSTATATSCSRCSRPPETRPEQAVRGYNSARSAASTTYGGSAPKRGRIRKPRLLALLLVLVRALGRGFQLRPRDGDPERARRARPRRTRGATSTRSSTRRRTSSASGGCSRSCAGTRAACSSKSDEIAPIMKQAIVAIEDKRFFEHNGVDVRGILARRVGGHPQQGGRRGRIDDHAAVRQERVQPQRPDDRAQGARGGARLAADAALVEGPDPHRLPQHDLLRQRCVRDPPGGADVLRRQERRGADASRGGAARGDPGEPLAVRPGAASRRGAAATRLRAAAALRPGADHAAELGRRTRRRCRSPRTSGCPARGARRPTSSTTSPTSSSRSTAPSGSSAAGSR